MEILAKLRYMAKQYSAGQVARGGGSSKHYLDEAADLIESLRAQIAELKAENERLKTVPMKYRRMELSRVSSRPCNSDGL